MLGIGEALFFLEDKFHSKFKKLKNSHFHRKCTLRKFTHTKLDTNLTSLSIAWTNSIDFTTNLQGVMSLDFKASNKY